MMNLFGFVLIIDDILLENVYLFQTIKNNSIVNVFSQNQENSFQSRCTTTQGNHDTFWSVELFSDGLLFGEPVVINSSYSDLLYSVTNNQYVSELNTFVTEDTSGRYLCSSSNTGIFETFILTYGWYFLLGFYCYHSFLKYRKSFYHGAIAN